MKQQVGSLKKINKIDKPLANLKWRGGKIQLKWTKNLKNWNNDATTRKQKGCAMTLV
jgi:hypothetical protein